MPRLPFVVFLAVVLPAATASWAAAAESETTWMKVMLEGRKIGHVEHSRTVEAGKVTTIERMELTIDRTGTSLTMSVEERSVETTEGRPLAFGARTRLGDTTTEVDGRLDDSGEAEVRISTGAREENRRVPWPEGAVLSEGTRLAEERRGLEPGTTWRVLAFQPSELIALPMSARVVGSERVSVDGRRETLVRVEQRIELPGTALTVQAWVTPAFEARRVVMPLLGLEMEMIACSKACATAPNQGSDILGQTLVRSPRALRRRDLDQGLAFELELAGDEPPRLPDTSEQSVTSGDDRRHATVRVDPTPDQPDITPPEDEDLRATRWLESDDPDLRKLAQQAVGDAEGAIGRMQRLEDFVRTYIADKGLQVGYASAAETMRARTGDCTEHALLLAALGRASGIPTRVVSGLAYAPGFAGREHVFVPHAWTEAWTGDRWTSFDAALAGFDAGHIAFASGDGDPSGFYAGVSLLGNVRILSIAPLEAVD